MDTNAEKTPYDLKSASKVFSRIGFSLVAFTFVSNLVAALLLVVWRILLAQEYTANAAIVISSISMYGIGIPVLRLCLGKTAAAPPPAGKARVSTVVILTAIAVMCTYFGNMLGTVVSALLENVIGFAPVEGTLELILQLPWYTALIFAAVIGPLAEEYIFRKLIIDRTRVYGEKLSVLFSALLFAFFHSSVQQFFYAFFIGLILGYLYMRTGKLGAVWTVHMLLNFLGSVVPLLLMQYCGYNELLEAMLAGEEALLVHIAEDPVGFTAIMLYGFAEMTIIILGCVFFWLYRKRVYFAEAEKTLPRDTEATVAFGNVGVILFIVVCVALLILTAYIG